MLKSTAIHFGLCAGYVLFFSSCLINSSIQPGQPPRDIMLGGEGSIIDSSLEAFSQPVPNLESRQITSFFVGKSLFEINWDTAPSSTTERDGLGPLFNARACSKCHTRDGRGSPPSDGAQMESMLMRLSIPGEDKNGGPLPEPNYGDQLNESSVLNLYGEGRAVITYSEKKGAYPDGQEYSLRIPKYQIEDLNYGTMDKHILISPRVAPHLIGMGLLENISEVNILFGEDVSDRNKDGISGKANWVWDRTKWVKRLGRFGWKANEPDMLQQVAGALAGDIGITSYLFPEGNHTPAQNLDSVPNGGNPEILPDDLRDLVLYSSALAVPARRNWDNPDVIKGSEIFDRINCSGCHIREYTTSSTSPIASLNNQKIHPFTDLLLHDMGEELADHRPDFLADGKEWRTPPLWGIGLFITVSGHSQFLHDGRARNLEEAILWHGGEAGKSKEMFMKLSLRERENLLAFLESL